MTGYASATALRREVSRLARPPERISVSEGAQRYARLRSPSGTPEPWSAEITPYGAQVLDALGGRKYRAVILAGPARTGKTGILLGWTADVIARTPADMMILHMSQAKAASFSRKELKRLINDSPSLASSLSASKHDDNIFAKYFKGGNVLGIGWPSDTQLAAETLKYVALTDYDRIVRNSGDEGSVFMRALKRTQTMGSLAKTYAESSPGFEVTDPRWQPATAHEAPPCDGILALYNQGTRNRRYMRCPICGDWFLEPSDPDKAWSWPAARDLLGATLVELGEHWGLACQANGCTIGPEHEAAVKRTALWVPEGCAIADGRVVGEPREAEWDTYWLLGPSAAYQRWKALAMGYLAAKRRMDTIGDEDDLRTWVNIDWGSAFLSPSKKATRDPTTLSQRREPHDRGTVPEGVRFLIATVDPQGGRDSRFVVQVHGYGEHLESWIVDRFAIRESGLRTGQIERIQPSVYGEHWDELIDQVMLRRYPLAGDPTREMCILLTAIDTGGEGDAESSVADQAYQFWRRAAARGLSGRLMLVKGSSRQQGKLIEERYPDTSGRADRGSSSGDVPVTFLASDRLKDTVWNRLMREAPGPGYCHFGDWLVEAWFQELTAEKRDSGGKWSKIAQRNEAFDLYCYGHAACVRMGADRLAWQAPDVLPPWARSPADNPEVVPADLGTDGDYAPLPPRGGRKVRARFC